MPKQKVDPSLQVLKYFEDAPLDAVSVVFTLAKETLRKRKGGETILTSSGPRIDPPQKRKKKQDPLANAGLVGQVGAPEE